MIINFLFDPTQLPPKQWARVPYRCKMKRITAMANNIGQVVTVTVRAGSDWPPTTAVPHAVVSVDANQKVEHVLHTPYELQAGDYVSAECSDTVQDEPLSVNIELESVPSPGL